MKTYIHTGADQFRPFVWQETHRLLPNKPAYGLWGCPYTPGEPSAWEVWKEAECFEEPADSCYFLFQLKPEARILTINSIKDYDSIDEELKNETLGTLNWDEISNHFDAVEVTRAHGYWCTCGSGSPAFSLTSWDVPSIVVLNSDMVVPIDQKR